MHVKVLDAIQNNPDGKDLKIKRPSSTWTYMVNDNPFANRLGIMLLNNANIGMQTDPFSLGLLLIMGFFKKVFPRKK